MATNDDWSVIADQLWARVRKVKPAADHGEIAGIIGEVRINTTIQGASTIEVDMIDPGWVLITSGFLDKGADDRLAKIDLNYPDGSNYWWRLTQADPTTDLNGPNLTLTFEARIVAYARDKKGSKSWSRAQYTRAEAIKSMTADEIDHAPKPVFISPELTEHQPIAVPGD